MRVRWLLKAVNDLEDLQEYIAFDNPYAASRQVEIILEAAARLEENPYIGRDGRVKGTRELVIPKTPFIAAYRIKDDVVEILRVLHGARKWPKRF
ncbi:MAG: type II toxin-antitoxin system mRNA interferase toxin, RelE/StbE family [Candidatus Aminicenantes bacterium]|nr:type II toxin-antitoxin system mRNA interferase toxin, RelE/StbE family [Candidatus Aminicenantes bacterium]NIM85135.1 type II toxin-antitoxin system mRNA interferase toxin, RelE/StbE family [Candidatus Aminicenantes bacterium]NIN24645.1 type II toxin-antitoxin system mRNA interferase toxin, RelE/StbE family [Candidatus Aminicenantes bacterium]NIN48406.1 type II toxin-antitoxin system mRNA interferase toxin, RelE/StbE family [Candidatus Aminicenantes bacterium]NIN91309.1 type II toxin-antito